MNRGIIMKRIVLFLMLISILPQIKVMAEENNTGTSVSITSTKKKANGKSATDAYLDMAYYKMIDKAGWNTSSVDNYYTYTEYSDDNVAWFTISCHGAINSTSMQKWTAATASKYYVDDGSSTPVSARRTWTSGTTDYSKIFPASSAYFTKATARAARSYDDLGSSTRPYMNHQKFYVTNVTEVRGYGYTSGYAYGSGTSHIGFNVYECTLKSDGTLESSASPIRESSDGAGTVTTYVKNLNASKIYLVDFFEYGGAYGYAVAFKIPLSVIKKPSLSVNPSSLTFNVLVSQTQKETFKVTGTDLIDDISATLTDQNNVFSLSSTTISQADASKGRNITVTFAPKAAGIYSATVTLSSTGAASKTVKLTATATEPPVRYKNSSTDTWHYLLPDASGTYNVSDSYYAFKVTEDVNNTNVTYTRSFTSGKWAPWIFPVEFTPDDSNYKFGSLESVNEESNNSDMTGSSLEVSYVPSGTTVKANMPYVIKPQSTGNKTFDFKNVTLKKTEEGSNTILGNVYDYTYTGLYTTKTASTEDCGWYYISTKGAFSLATGNTTLNIKPFRSYLSVTDHNGGSSSAKDIVFNITDGGNTTGINEIQPRGIKDDYIYDLQGRRVKAPTAKGVYIINGRKVIMK